MSAKGAAAEPQVTGDARRDSPREQGYLKTFFRAVDSVTPRRRPRTTRCDKPELGRTTGINETQLFIRDSDLQGLSREEAVPGGGRPGRDLEFGPGSGGGMMVIASIQKAI
jgi:hypothetical protein